MTRVLPLPAPARMSTGPSVVSTASRCCGLSWSRKDKCGTAPSSLIEFYRGSTIREGCPAIPIFSIAARIALHSSHGTHIAQKLPGINAQLVAIIPVKLDGVFAHALSRQWLGRLLEHGQRAGRELGRLAGFAAGLATLVVTQSAGAGIAQEGKWVVGAVAVLPLDVHAGACSQVHFDRLGIRPVTFSVSHDRSWVWGGHSCPPPLNLICFRAFDYCRTALDQLQKRRTRVSAPHRLVKDRLEFR